MNIRPHSSRAGKKRTKLSRKILYHFAILTIVNETLTFKNSQICMSARFILLPKIQSIERTARGPRGAGMA